jgi:hypothetical protein
MQGMQQNQYLKLNCLLNYLESCSSAEENCCLPRLYKWALVFYNRCQTHMPPHPAPGSLASFRPLTLVYFTPQAA